MKKLILIVILLGPWEILRAELLIPSLPSFVRAMEVPGARKLFRALVGRVLPEDLIALSHDDQLKHYNLFVEQIESMNQEDATLAGFFVLPEDSPDAIKETLGADVLNNPLVRYEEGALKNFSTLKMSLIEGVPAGHNAIDSVVTDIERRLRERVSAQAILNNSGEKRLEMRVIPDKVQVLTPDGPRELEAV